MSFKGRCINARRAWKRAVKRAVMETAQFKSQKQDVLASRFPNRILCKQRYRALDAIIELED